MAKYIEREELVEWLKRIPLKDLSDGLGLCRVIMEEDFKRAIRTIPDGTIIDVAPVQEWISVDDELPENSKKEGAFCPRYFVMTKYGESFGWYNPNFKSWFVLFWFFTDRLLEKEIDFERADVPKIVKVPDGVVTHWMPLPEPPKGE